MGVIVIGKIVETWIQSIYQLRYTASFGEYSDIIGKRPGRCTVMQNGAEVKEPARMGGKERSLGCVRSASDMLVRLVRS